MRRYRKEHSSTPDTIVNQNEAEKVKAFKEDIRIWGKAVGELVEEVSPYDRSIKVALFIKGN